MALYLKLETDENYDFFVLFDNLSPLRQKIWRKLVQKCQAWTLVQPNQTSIAKWCGCSRSAVSEAFRLFKDYGWLSLQSRGWKRSKKIFIPLSKQQIDLEKKDYFRSVKATYRATHTNITRETYTGKKTAGDIAIRHPLKNKEMPLELKLKLSMVSECTFNEALFQCKKIAKKGFKPNDEAKYLSGVCINIAKRKGEKLDWRSYYSTLNKMNGCYYTK